MKRGDPKGAECSEVEGAPVVVEAVRVGETDIAPCRAVLSVAGLHPHNVLWYAGLGGDGEAAHAAADARESGSMDANVLESADHHCGDKGGGRDGVVRDRVGTIIGELELREERRADWAACSGAALLGASWLGVRADQVHEQAELVVDVERRVSRFAEAHFVSGTDLVVLTLQGTQ